MAQRLSDLVADLGWRLQGEDAAFGGVAIDNRKVNPGDLFIALRGERHDGHIFVADALARGAAAVVVDHPLPVPGPLLVVENTQVALGQLAARHRARWHGRMFALTGSAGKTSTKEMLAAILRLSAPVHATRGNFNNEIGVPLTLLGLEAAHHCAVLELGAAKPGDIAYLVALVQPDVSVLTNAMPAHLQGFGSIDQVAQTKGEIFVAQPDRVAVINLDDAFAGQWCSRAGSARITTFSQHGSADAEVRATGLSCDTLGCSFTLHCSRGECDITLNVPGVHNVANALAAAAAALAAGVSLDDVKKGLAQFGGVAGRMQLRAGRDGLQLIDDTYNANPIAVRSALDVLAGHAGGKLFILGDMAELGESGVRLHEEVGRYARQVGIDGLLAAGPLAAHAAQSFGPGGRSFASREQLQDWLAETDLTRNYKVCLVKGSRSAAMEHVVHCLLESAIEGRDATFTAVAATDAQRQGAH